MGTPKMRSHALAAAVFSAYLASPLASQESSIERIIDFEGDVVGEWFVVNDGVMGGRSSSALTAESDGVALFEGYLSLENNGGFASVRTRVPANALAGASRIILRVRGDGKRYQVRLRTDGRFDGIAFGASFDTTAGRWSTVELPLQSFEPTFRGYRPPGVGPLDPSQISQVGIMLTDGQEGRFRLEMDWIAVDRTIPPS